MPPRRRRTKLTNRSNPKLPQGDDDDMSGNERRDKMDLLLRDFDLEVKDRLEQMRKEAHKMCSLIHTLFRLEMCKMNKDVLHMTRKEFLLKGGIVNEVALREVSQYVDNISLHVTKPMQQGKNSGSKTARKACSKSPPLTKKKRTARKAPTTRKKKENLAQSSGTEEVYDNSMPPPLQTVRRSTRKNANTHLVTPSNPTGSKRGLATTCWNTPAVTPKFDPRLAITPGSRKPRKGEQLMSMTGSPVNNTLSESLKDNMLVFSDQFQHLNAKDEVTKRNIEMLQKSLAAILYKLPKPN